MTKAVECTGALIGSKSTIAGQQSCLCFQQQADQEEVATSCRNELKCGGHVNSTNTNLLMIANYVSEAGNVRAVVVSAIHGSNQTAA
jgi:hypothetical protein